MASQSQLQSKKPTPLFWEGAHKHEINGPASPPRRAVPDSRAARLHQSNSSKSELYQLGFCTFQDLLLCTREKLPPPPPKGNLLPAPTRGAPQASSRR